ncbi:MAG: hypothetical protein B7Y31_12400, partial [Novosphingobium sp. 16-62-11]
MRVLLVGNAHERAHGGRCYTVERKLANGFVRNGHLVHFFSDRDVAAIRQCKIQPDLGAAFG